MYTLLKRERITSSVNILCSSLFVFFAFLAVFYVSDAIAHGVPEGDKGFIHESSGILPGPFIYLGAKHMVTGYDHLLFLFGVIFFIYRLKEVALYVSLFAIGHTITLLSGVLAHITMNAYLIDMIIGFSVVYKALDNLGAFKVWFGIQLDTKAATFLFGLIHGLGLATKIQEFDISSYGLIYNLVFFNIGVELGQILALSAILIVMGFWRLSGHFYRQAYAVNVVMMSLGFMLMGYQLLGFIVQG